MYNSKRYENKVTSLRSVLSSARLSSSACNEDLTHQSIEWMMRPQVKPHLLCFRGAGNLAYFHAGVWKGIMDTPYLYNLFKDCKLGGISSGALIATLIATNIPLEIAIRRFHKRLALYKAEYNNNNNNSNNGNNKVVGSFATFTKIRYVLMYLFKMIIEPFLKCRIECQTRFLIFGDFLREHITDTDVCTINKNGRLSIAVFSFNTMSVIWNDRWHNLEHIIEWLHASMSIPFITSGPRIVHTFDGHRHLAMDAFNFDRICLLKYWNMIWQCLLRLLKIIIFFTAYIPGLATKSRLLKNHLTCISYSAQNQGTVVQVSPLEYFGNGSKHIIPIYPFSFRDVITCHSDRTQRFIYAIGRLAALRFWILSLQERIWSNIVQTNK